MEGLQLGLAVVAYVLLAIFVVVVTNIAEKYREEHGGKRHE